MTESRWNPEKPLVITAICIIGIINAIQMINLVLSPMSKQVGAIYPLYFSLSIAISLVCIGGLWLLKRWAALVYLWSSINLQPDHIADDGLLGVVGSNHSRGDYSIDVQVYGQDVLGLLVLFWGA